jgi:hypothetical protein
MTFEQLRQNVEEQRRYIKPTRKRYVRRLLGTFSVGLICVSEYAQTEFFHPGLAIIQCRTQ